MTLWEILKANKTGIAPDMFTMLAASKMNGGRGRLHELSGIPPLSFTAKGKLLTAWSITGNTVQNGTPTPDTPQEVKAVGDKTSNLLNFEDLIAAPSGEMPSKDFLFPHLLILYLKPNTTYTCASSGTGSTTSSPSDLNRSLYFCATSEHNSVNVNNPVTYTTDSTGRVFIGFIDFRTNAQQYLNKTAYIWLNEGSTVLPYEPYGYKIPVVTRGKNLAGNYTVSSGYYYDDSGTPTPSDARFIRLTINVEPNTIYTISSNLKFYSIWEFNNNIKISRSGGNNSNKYTIKTTKECNSLRISMINTSGEADTSAFEWIQLEKGSTATPYEPYHEPITTPIYLPTPLYRGEVLRSDGSRDVKWGKIILTGEETSISIYSGAGSNGVAMIIANMQKGFYQYGFCSHAIVARNHDDGTIGLGVNNNTLYWFGILDILGLSASLVAPFKKWLKEQYAAGTPVTVWYQLATPTTETVTVPQIPTLNGTTVIDVDTAVKPTEMYTKYKSSK